MSKTEFYIEQNEKELYIDSNGHIEICWEEYATGHIITFNLSHSDKTRLIAILQGKDDTQE